MTSTRVDSGFGMNPRESFDEGIRRHTRMKIAPEVQSRTLTVRKDSRRTQSSVMLRVPHPAPRRKAQSHSAASNEPLPKLLPISSQNELILPPPPPSSSSLPQLNDEAQDATTSKPRYYQDPEARMKLKTYFSSEQKFDELLEFGFPTMAIVKEQGNNATIPDNNKGEAKGNSIESRKTSETYQGFMLADSPPAASDVSSVDLEIEKLDSSSSVDDSDGPATPTEITDATGCYLRYVGQLKSKYSAVDIAKPLSDQRALPPLPPPSSKSVLTIPAPKVHVRHQSGSTNTSSTAEVAANLNPEFGPREMTLKLSLTRSDLRDSENSNNSNQKSGEETNPGCDGGIHAAPKDGDPLALQALPVFSEDATGAHSPFPAQKVRLRDNLMQKLRGRLARR